MATGETYTIGVDGSGHKIGVFCAGNCSHWRKKATAVKTAVMTEDVAKTVWLAMQIGTVPEPLPDDVAKLHDRYIHVYRQ